VSNPICPPPYAFLTLALSGGVSAQVSGNFYLDKFILAPGEPVFLHFQTMNKGPNSFMVQQADPYTFCAGFQINEMRSGSYH
jgi:hypothetical protein